MSKATKFEQFHQDNPHVYDVLVSLARTWKRRTGRSTMAIASLFEVARWEVSMSTNSPDYKISNDHKPFYARLIMLQEPDLQDAFVIKESEADEWMSARLANA